MKVIVIIKQRGHKPCRKQVVLPFIRAYANGRYC